MHTSNMHRRSTKRGAPTGRVRNIKPVPSLDRPVLDRSVLANKSTNNPTNARPESTHTPAINNDDVPLLSSKTTVRAPSSPLSSSSAAPLERLMVDRESRLSDLRQKLALWEENLTLAQVDQDRLRTDLSKKMAEATSVRKQWEQSRENLKIERRQMDALTKSLQGRESAVAARERQAQFTEDALKERQSKMEKIAIDMAEKKVQAEYNIKFQTLKRKEMDVDVAQSEIQETLADGRRRLNDAKLTLDAQKEEHAGTVQTFDTEKTKAKKLMKSNLDKNKETEKKLQARESKTSKEENLLKKERIRMEEVAASLMEREKHMKEMSELIVKKESDTKKKEENMKNILLQIQQEKKEMEKKNQQSLERLEKDRLLLEKEKQQHDEMVKEKEKILDAREAGTLASEGAMEERKVKMQGENIESTRLFSLYSNKMKESIEKEKSMATERSELDALARQLEERRKGLDVLDRHLQAFGEDCEVQREMNEKETLELKSKKQMFVDEMAEGKMKMSQERMRLTMEAESLEQEKSMSLGHVHGISKSKKQHAEIALKDGGGVGAEAVVETVETVETAAAAAAALGKLPRGSAAAVVKSRSKKKDGSMHSSSSGKQRRSRVEKRRAGKE